MSLETLSLKAQLLDDYAKRYPSDAMRTAVTKAGCADRTAALISARKQPIIANGDDIRSIDILGAQWDLLYPCHSGTLRI